MGGNMKRYLVVLFTFFAVAACAGLTLSDLVVVGGDGDDVGNDIVLLEDGGVVIAGYTTSLEGTFFSSHGQEDFLVARFDEDLELVWWKAYGGSKRDVAQALTATRDGGFVLAGLTESSDGDVTDNKGLGDFWVISVSSTGEFEWQKTFGGSSQDYAYDVAETPEGNILVAGYTRSDNGDVLGYDWGEDFWIIELGRDGELLRQWLAGGYRSEDCAKRIAIGDDGSIYVVGYYAFRDCNISCNYVEEQTSVLKIGSDGVIQWFNQYGDYWPEAGIDLLVADNGNIVVVGEEEAGVSLFTSGLGGKDFWIAYISPDGTEISSNNFGGSFSDIANGIVQVGEDEFIVAGYSTSSDKDVADNHGMADGWIIRVNTAGKILDKLAVGGSEDDAILSVFSRDKTLYFTGYSTSSEMGNSGGKDLFVFAVVE
jgi:hypothetical protein